MLRQPPRLTLAAASLAAIAIGGTALGVLSASGEETDMPHTTLTLTHAAPAQTLLAVTATGDNAALFFSLEPLTVAREAPFLVDVILVAQNGSEHRAGSVSFFPPPVQGQARDFSLPVPGSLSQGQQVTIRLEIVPADDATPLQPTEIKLHNPRIGRPAGGE